MKTVTNKGQRRLGLPGRPAIVLNPGQSEPVNDAQLAEMRNNKTVCRWMENGIVEVSGETKAPQKAAEKVVEGKTEHTPDLPEGLTGEGFEIYHEGGGWNSVWVNGFKVTDTKVRKDEAESMRSDYE